MSCDTCVNINDSNKCGKCNGTLYYKPYSSRYKVKASKRQGSQLEVDTIQLRPNSGATMFKKGDCISANTLIECKETSAKSIRITKEMIDKIGCESKREDKMPVLNFRMDNSPIYSIIRYEDLLTLLEDTNN